LLRSRGRLLDLDRVAFLEGESVTTILADFFFDPWGVAILIALIGVLNAAAPPVWRRDRKPWDQFRG
jgi:hypothetical protein